MDFKVAGTERGVTALQMDLKIESINKGIMKVALDQAREARLQILDIMKQAIEGSRAELSTFAPRIIKIKINPDKIRDVIGKGGVVIRGIQEETGTTIEIEDDGTVSIACVSAEGGEAAKKRIQELTRTSRSAKSTRHRAQASRLRRDRAAAAGPRRSAAHLADQSRARERRVRLPEGRPGGEGEGAGGDDKGRVRLSMKAVEPKGETAKQGG